MVFTRTNFVVPTGRVLGQTPENVHLRLIDTTTECTFLAKRRPRIALHQRILYFFITYSIDHPRKA